MSAPSYTYSLANGTTASASEVMQNFNDILNGVADGSKDLSINALTCAGTATLNGSVTLGNASSKDITFTGSLASTIPIKTTNSYDIGSTTLGLRVAYFGANSQTVGIKGSASMSATWVLTLPVSAGTANYALTTDGSGVGSWTAWSTSAWAATATARGTITTFVPVIASAIKAVASANYTVLDNDGYDVISVTTGNSTRTITLPTAADNAGRKLVIKKVDSGTGFVIIDGEGAETVEGAATQTIYAQYGGATIYCDGTSWYLDAPIRESGLYTPTLNNTTNVATSTAYASHWTRLGLNVTVSGHVDIDPTSATTATVLDMTVPLITGNNFSSVDDAQGIGGSYSGDYVARVIANSGAATVAYSFTTAADVSARAHYFVFTYTLI